MLRVDAQGFKTSLYMALEVFTWLYLVGTIGCMTFQGLYKLLHGSYLHSLHMSVHVVLNFYMSLQVLKNLYNTVQGLQKTVKYLYNIVQGFPLTV